MTHKPNVFEMAALRSYAKEFGRRWKSELAKDWENARARVADDMEERGVILHGLRNNFDFGPTGLDKFQFPKPAIDGPWEMSGPEEGDGDDTVLVCNHDADNYEVITITEGTLAKRKSIARRIAALLNEGKAVLN